VAAADGLRRRAFALGAAAALALLSKLSALVFLPAAGLALLLCHVRSGRATRPPARSRLRSTRFAYATALLLVWSGYRFSVGPLATPADAPAARELMAVRPPDLIVSDIRMPVVSGTEFVAGLREDPALARIPVIYLTGLEENTELAVKTVGYPLLAKPLKAPELLKLVRTQLGEARAPR